MENDTFSIDANVISEICKHKEKIERHFGVRILIDEEKSDENEVTGYSTCQVVSLSNAVEENVDRAKRYIQAISASGPDLKTLQETYDADTVSKLLHFKSDIERETCVVIETSEGKNSITFHGSQAGIEKAKQLTDSLALGQHTSHIPAIARDTSLQHSFMPTNNNFIGTNYSNLKHPNSEVVHSDELNSDSSDDDDEDVQEQVIKSTPDYRSKLEFAFKLGYRESDLLEALKHLERNAGQNELLSELIKNSTSRNEELEGAENDSGYGVDGKEGGADVQEGQKKGFVGDESSPFRHVIVDGSNVAMSHGNKEMFSCMGIKLAVDWFRERGHTGITVFVPQWRKETSRTDARIRDQHILNELEKEKVLVFTPSRRIGGKRVICYDDRYILKLAVETDGIVVSNDNYRDLIGENEQFKKVVEERLLMYSFVNDRFMPPDDPLGRSGPTLDNFLMKEPAEPEPLPPPCPYGSKKCTYGNKCKYYHPERRTQPHKSVTEKLAEQAKQRMLEMRRDNSLPADGKKKLTRTKTPLQRTQSGNPEEIRKREVREDSGARNKEGKVDDYNQKLSESLKKMELNRTLSESEIHKSISPRSQDSREFSPRSKLAEQPGRSSPRLSELRQKGRSTPRGNSPINLVVPGHSDQDQGEKFLSGHLLLAKKLSDEANESDKFKKKSKGKGEDAKYHFAFTGSDFNTPELAKKQPLSRAGDKQKLSRQLSLQGGEDPRLGRVPLHAQLSYDPRQLRKDPRYAAVMNPEERRKMLQDFMHVQRKDLTTASQRGLYGADDRQPRSVAQEHIGGHAALGRMPSAPDPSFPPGLSPGQVPIMTRQNSSSDTQLNKISGFENDIQVDGMLARGPSENLPMRDTTGAVTFQIGGPVNQNIPNYRPMTSAGQGFSPVSQMNYRYQQSVSPDYHQGSRYIPQNQMMSPHVQNYNQVQTPFHYPPTNFPYVDHSNIWTPPNQVQQNVTNVPQQFVTKSMSPLTIHNPDLNIQPTSTANPHGHMQPVPVDMPILPNNPRFRLYRDLCNLFPEEAVRMVMNQHPEENNPKQLCAYIISYT